MRRFVIVLGLFLFPIAIAAQPEPLFGTWKMNASKSKYDPDPHHQSQIVRYERTSDGFKMTLDTIPANGSAIHTETVAKGDGQDYPVVGSRNVTERAFMLIDPQTWQIVSKLNGKVMETLRQVVSPDGRMLTVTITGTTPQGDRINSVVVFDRQ